MKGSAKRGRYILTFLQVVCWMINKGKGVRKGTYLTGVVKEEKKYMSKITYVGYTVRDLYPITCFLFVVTKVP